MHLPEQVITTTPYDWILGGTTTPAVVVSRNLTSWQGNPSFLRLINTLEFCRHFFSIDKSQVRLRKRVADDLREKPSARRKLLIREVSGVRRFYQVIATVPQGQLIDEWLLFFLHPLPFDHHLASFPATFRKGESSTPRTEFSIQLGKRLKIAKQMELRLLVFVLDIVGFRSVNESEGYHIGDKVLSILQHRLGFIAKHNGIIAHIADDDYAVGVLVDDKPEAIHTLISRMSNAVRKPYFINENKQRLFLRLAVGAALSTPNTDSAWRLVEQARTACVMAKRQSSSEVIVYDQLKRLHSSEQFRLEQKVFQAVESDAFHIVVQPQYSISNKTLVGAEILLRWVESDGTSHSPGEFIPILEKMGLMPKLSEWILEQAIDIQSVLLKHCSPPPLSINLSPSQIEHSHHIRNFLTILSDRNLPGKFIEIEITEDSLLRHHQQTLANLNLLSKAGVSVALDDFGVGYSSLSYLQQFPIQKLKIDRSFIINITNDHQQRQLVSLMIRIAETFDMIPLAEGVELEEQVDFLRDLGCRYIQGYVYAKPENVNDYSARVRASCRG